MSIAIFFLNVGIFILNLILAELVATIITFGVVGAVLLFTKWAKKDDIPDWMSGSFVPFQIIMTIGVLVFFLSGHGVPYQ
ncbi:MAG: hypothetical protein Q4A96_03065 [Candidatus Saccharibacteria bacterium]|nr:hypothetical protein [Candidatus Saccharibacteria bacterium]